MLSRVAICSLALTALFFFEYNPPFRAVHIPYDLLSFHYPLADYAFQAIRHGRFPTWDPTIYCGMSFVANVQAALFYPPQWIMMAASSTYRKLPYQAMEFLSLGHVWIGFMTSFLWLFRGKRFHWLAAVLGAGIFAFSGFMMLQLQHIGLIGGYVWLPLGFWGIDEAAESNRIRPLWKLVVACALCVLAGYPSMWVVFAISIGAYAAVRVHGFRLLTWSVMAMIVACVLCAAQLLPASEATALKVPDPKYSRTAGIKDPRFFISYVSPNYYDFSMLGDIQRNRGQEYLYLGAIALVGLGLLIRRNRIRAAFPELSVLVVSLIFLTNPFGFLGSLIEGTFLAQVFSAWYFLAGISAGFAGLAAFGLDAEIQTRGRRAWPPWLGIIVLLLSGAWCVRLLILWSKHALPILSWSTLDAFIGVCLCYLLLSITRSRSRIAPLAAGVLIAFVAMEYKSFGTSKRFNADKGPYDTDYSVSGFPGMNDAVLRQMHEHPEYRLATDELGPDPLQLRNAGLTSPQGMDPFLTADYRDLISKVGSFLPDHRRFDLDPGNKAALRLLGVRYVGTAEGGPLFQRLLEDPAFKLLRPDDSYYKIFELNDSRPGFGWVSSDGLDRIAETVRWEPERRVFKLRSPTAATFRLTEQIYPGWSARVDGSQVSISSCQEAFQCVEVPAGEHILEFQYRSRWLRLGTILSLSVTVALGTLLWISRSSTGSLSKTKGRFSKGFY